MKFALITTTINTPHNLKAYAKDIAEHGPKDTMIVISGDKRTPDLIPFCKDIYFEYNVRIIYLSPEEQKKMFSGYSDFLGWNTIQRRNIAMLYAYHLGAEIIVIIDDDNFITSPGYFNHHAHVGKTSNHEVVYSESGWYNICSRLHATNYKGDIFYPRGYSVKERGSKNFARIKSFVEPVKCVVNAGLWLGDPDIDAVTRLALNPWVTYAAKDVFALGKDTYSPFNSQNTAVHRSVLPAYCMISNVGRFDDIIPSFFVKRITDHLGDSISFGGPIVKQERNTHDLWKDLDGEREGMHVTDDLVAWLKNVELTGGNYRECLKEIYERYKQDNDKSMQAAEARLFHVLNKTFESYKAWSLVV